MTHNTISGHVNRDPDINRSFAGILFTGADDAIALENIVFANVGIQANISVKAAAISGNRVYANTEAGIDADYIPRG